MAWYGAANRHLGKSDRKASGVLSSAQRHTHFLDSARITRSMAGLDFRFGELKVGPVHGLPGAAARAVGDARAGLVQVFNVADIETAHWVSRSIGATTASYETSGASTSRTPNQFFSTHSTSTTTHLSRRDLIAPDEILRLDQALEILLQPRLRPIWTAWKVGHYADPEFAGLFAR